MTPLNHPIGHKPDELVSLPHPGTWLPGDRLIDRDGDLFDRGPESWSWRHPHERDSRGAWPDSEVDLHLEKFGGRIVHLVPRDQPPVLPDVTIPADLAAEIVSASEAFDIDPGWCAGIVERLANLIDPPPAPEPAPEPWECISYDRDKPTLAEVVLRGQSPFTGLWWRDKNTAYMIGVGFGHALRDVTSVSPLAVLPEDCVAVPREVVVGLIDDPGNYVTIGHLDVLRAALDAAEGGAGS